MANPAEAVLAAPGFVVPPARSSQAVEAQGLRRFLMHAVIRKYTAAPDVAAEARPQLDHLMQTMRQTPGFVAYYFLETEDGIATITITEDEAGTQESMGRAATWVRQNLPDSNLGAPEVTTGQVRMHATR
jgi:quinol monooxygenase YgiN